MIELACQPFPAPLHFIVYKSKNIKLFKKYYLFLFFKHAVDFFCELQQPAYRKETLDFTLLRLETPERRKVRVIEDNGTCRHLKNLICKGTLRQVFICLPPRTPYPSAPYTLYRTVYTVNLFTQGGGGAELNQREG
jgi:hypothetical protein